jgi:predicted RNA-binding protein YlqC (UPF0109 family)
MSNETTVNTTVLRFSPVLEELVDTPATVRVRRNDDGSTTLISVRLGKSKVFRSYSQLTNALKNAVSVAPGVVV